MKKILLISILLISCGFSLIKYPSKDVYQQNMLFCYYKQNGKWKLLGSRDKCPDNTYFNADSPVD